MSQGLNSFKDALNEAMGPLYSGDVWNEELTDPFHKLTWLGQALKSALEACSGSSLFNIQDLQTSFAVGIVKICGLSGAMVRGLEEEAGDTAQCLRLLQDYFKICDEVAELRNQLAAGEEKPLPLEFVLQICLAHNSFWADFKGQALGTDLGEGEDSEHEGYADTIDEFLRSFEQLWSYYGLYAGIAQCLRVAGMAFAGVRVSEPGTRGIAYNLESVAHLNALVDSDLAANGFKPLLTLLESGEGAGLNWGAFRQHVMDNTHRSNNDNLVPFNIDNAMRGIREYWLYKADLEDYRSCLKDVAKAVIRILFSSSEDEAGDCQSLIQNYLEILHEVSLHERTLKFEGDMLGQYFDLSLEGLAHRTRPVLRHGVEIRPLLKEAQQQGEIEEDSTLDQEPNANIEECPEDTGSYLASITRVEWLYPYFFDVICWGLMDAAKMLENENASPAKVFFEVLGGLEFPFNENVPGESPS